MRSLLLLRADGDSTLAVPRAIAPLPAVTRIIVFDAAPLGTMVDDQLDLAAESLAEHFPPLKRIGADSKAMPYLSNPATNIDSLLFSWKRSKLPDEIALIAHGIRACQAAYAAAKAIIKPGLSELSLYTHLLAVATEAVGEPIGDFGNDFRSGGGGGPPRDRAMQAGELIPLDLGVAVRGYHSDLCRTFAIDGKPTAVQREAQQHVCESLAFVEQSVKPGVSCRKLYEEVANQLRPRSGWRFPHHLGHGIGLAAHESPRLNPNWDDVFQEGDVFAAEPAVYADELRGGIRLEQDYVVVKNGLRLLSDFPLDL
jgi:Xaa-Pro aminopeptidase